MDIKTGIPGSLLIDNDPDVGFCFIVAWCLESWRRRSILWGCEFQVIFTVSFECLYPDASRYPLLPTLTSIFLTRTIVGRPDRGV